MNFLKRHAAILLILSFCLSLASCGFVNYVHYPVEEIVEKEQDFDTVLAQKLASIALFSNPEFCHESKRPEYQAALLDAKNELNECSTVARLNEVYEKHITEIISIVLNSYVNLEDYRSAEQESIRTIMGNHAQRLRYVGAKEDIYALLRDFETQIYDFKTDMQYYAEELTSLKKSLSSQFSKAPNYVEYADAEVQQINALIAEFENKINVMETKELAQALFEAYVSKFLEIPTLRDLEIQYKNEAVEFWKVKLKEFAQQNALTVDNQISELLLLMQDCNTARQVNLLAAQFIMEQCMLTDTIISKIYASAAKLYLENMVPIGDYREEQKTLMSEAITSAAARMDTSNTFSSIHNIFLEAKNLILGLPTSDDLWQREDQAFFDELKQLYGENILAAPEKMYEASNYQELAAIIDYYAFYQMSNEAFLRNTFRVKLLYPHKTGEWEINEVYWYCELIRGAVGISGRLESVSSGTYLVITLVPYALATNTNNTNAPDEPFDVDRYEALYEYKRDDSTTYSKRTDDFNDFAYLTQSTKQLNGVWNTHQLWYAFEQGYLPNVVPNSAAERTLEKAKEIMREIILEGMSDEEKIYAIFSYFSRNVIFDDGYSDYLYPKDRDHFPDELTATLASYHIEGALFDHLAVCEGFAKAMLLMLRMEGIECYRVFLHGYTENAVNNLGQDGYGSHAMVVIKMSDGEFYLSDPYEAYQHNTRYPKLHQFLIPWDLHTTYVSAWSLIYTDLVYGDTMLDSVMDHIVYNGNSIFIKDKNDLTSLLNDFRNEIGTDICISVFTWTDRLTEEINVESYLTQNGVDYHKITYKGLTEYILYK